MINNIENNTITSMLGAFLQDKDKYYAAISSYSDKLHNSIAICNDKKNLEFILKKISIYTKLYYIAENYEAYEKYIYKAYYTMCDNTRCLSSDDLDKLEKCDKVLNRIIKKVK